MKIQKLFFETITNPASGNTGKDRKNNVCSDTAGDVNDIGGGDVAITTGQSLRKPELEDKTPKSSGSKDFDSSDDDLFMIAASQVAVKPIPQSTQISQDPKEHVPGSQDAGSFDDSNDDIFVASTQSTSPLKSAAKRCAGGTDAKASKLAKLITEGDKADDKKFDIVADKPEQEELKTNFLAEELEEAEVELEVKSRDLFEGWKNLERELDEPVSGEQFQPAQLHIDDKDLYADADATKGDMYQNIEVEGDEDTDDEDLYYPKDNIGSIHEVEEDVEHEQAMALAADNLKKNGSTVSLPSGQSQLIDVEGGTRDPAVANKSDLRDAGRDAGVDSSIPTTGNETVNEPAGNVDNNPDVLLENVGPDMIPDQDVRMPEANLRDNVDGGANGGADGGDNGEDDLENSNNLYQIRGRTSTYTKNQEMTKKM